MDERRLVETFVLGQWVVVKAHVITVRKYSSKAGEEAKSIYWMQGRRKWRFYPDCDGWIETHTPEGKNSSVKVCLFRRELATPIRMLVVGKTYRATGYYDPGHPGSYARDKDYEEPYLSEDMRHTVYLLRKDLRWQAPTLALARDMEIIEDALVR